MHSKIRIYLETGLVFKSTGSWYKVRSTAGQFLNCKITGKLREASIRSTNPVSVGDIVGFEREDDGVGVIKLIHPRRNYIIRKSTNLSHESHIVAANIDRAYIIVTVKSPKTHLAFIDRFLVSAQAYRIPVTLVFNKIDLCQGKDLETLDFWQDMYTQLGYDTIRVSAKDNINIDELRTKLSRRTSLVSGNSGVGKSTLINTIDPTLDLKTSHVSKSHDKGTHTTTFAEMFELEQGGYIIDTPGLKGFGLLDMENWEISHYFPEMFALLEKCEFYNCTHTHEPGCEVKKALEEYHLFPSRYENYLAMLDDNQKEKYRR